MEQIIALLLSTPAVTAIVGNRVRVLIAKQTDSTPYVVIHRVSDTRGYTYAGNDGLKDVYLQANCIVSKEHPQAYGLASNLAAALVSALDGYRGGAIQGIFIENAGRELATADAGEVNQLIGIAVDFRVRLSA